MMKRLVLPLVVTACTQTPAQVPSITRADPEVPVLVKWDLSPPLAEIAPVATSGQHERERERHPPILIPTTPDFVDPVAQLTMSPPLLPAAIQNFDGVGQGFTGPAGTFQLEADPPDDNGDVGPNHYVQTVNISFAVFSKTGTPLYGPASIKTVWSGFSGPCAASDDGDPLIKYDRIGDRWIISQFVVQSSPNYECVAVSATGDPTGQWNRYAFQYNANIDYPKMGVWPDAYYFTQNTDAGANVCAFERSAMMAGTMARSQCFNTTTAGLMPADFVGRTQPAAGTPEYVLALDTNALSLWKLHIDWATPANSALMGPTSIPVEAFTQPTEIQQPGSTTTLDAIGEQLMYGVSYRKFDDHEALVVNHTVGTQGRIGLRWYEIRDPGGSPTVFQQGTFVPDASQRWMGSINIDHAGDIAIGYTVAGDVAPSVRYAGRLASDPTGQMAQGEASLMAGTGKKTDNQNPSRWGDYSTMSVDPSDDCTFWYTQEYLASDGMNWHTRIGSFKFPSCDGSGGSGGSGGVGGSGGAGGAGGTPGSGGSGGTGDVGGNQGSGGSGGNAGQMGGVMSGCGCDVGAAHGPMEWMLFALVVCAGFSARRFGSSRRPKHMRPGACAGNTSTPL
jgi:hypothetical protein